MFATRENLFSLLAMAGSPKENGTIVVIFEGNFPKIKVLILFFLCLFKNLSTMLLKRG